MRLVRLFLVGLLLALPGLLALPTTTATLAAAQDGNSVKTYTVLLRVWDTGTLVASKQVSFGATNGDQATRAIAFAQAAFGRDLNDQKKRWNRIDYVLLGIN